VGGLRDGEVGEGNCAEFGHRGREYGMDGGAVGVVCEVKEEGGCRERGFWGGQVDGEVRRERG